MALKHDIFDFGCVIRGAHQLMVTCGVLEIHNQLFGLDTIILYRRTRS